MSSQSDKTSLSRGTIIVCVYMCVFSYTDKRGKSFVFHSDFFF